VGSGSDVVTNTAVVASDRSFSTSFQGSVLALAALPVLSASVTTLDAAGNSATFSASQTFNVDTTAPVAPSFAITDLGDSSSDRRTSSTLVTVSGLEPGASWQWSRNGGSSWTSVNPVTDGSTITIATSFNLPAGTYTAGQLRVRQIDAAGNTGAVAQSSATIWIDTTAPAVTIDAIGGTDAVLSSATSADALITGTAEASRTVTIKTPVGVVLGTTQANASGVWSYALTPANITSLGQGDNRQLVASLTDVAGNSSSVSSAPFRIDTLVQAGSISVAGASGTGGTFRIGDTVTATISDPNADTAAVHVDFSALGAGVVAASRQANGSWTASVTLSSGSVDLAAAQVQARFTDLAGNTSAPALSSPLLVDTQAAAVAVDRQLSNGTVSTLSGSLANLDSGVLTVVFNGATYRSSDVPSRLSISGNSWTLTLPSSVSLTPGNYSVIASITDNAGNTSSEATSGELLVLTPAQVAERNLSGAASLAVTGRNGLGVDETIALIAQDLADGTAPTAPLSLSPISAAALSAEDQASIAQRYGTSLSLASDVVQFQATGTGVSDLGLVKFLFSLPSGSAVNTYLKRNSAGVWEEFNYDATSGTGARLEDLNSDGTADALAVYVRDGGRGDDDGLVNGQVLDPGLLASSSTRLGDAGANTLQGNGSSPASLSGGAGDDTYIVTSTSDRVVESGTGGNDTVITSVSYVLQSSVETIQLTGSALDARGNELDNVMLGNSLANRLEGLGGNDLIAGGFGDTLLGGDGDDLLINLDRKSAVAGARSTLSGDAGNDLLAGAGPDSLSGGLGDDTLVVFGRGANLTGGAGLDRFVLEAANRGSGRTVINDFIATGAGREQLQLVGFTKAGGSALAYGDLALQQVFGGTSVKNGNDELVFLKGVNTTELSSDVIRLSSTLSTDLQNRLGNS
jgi:hypothetical protein